MPIWRWQLSFAVAGGNAVGCAAVVAVDATVADDDVAVVDAVGANFVADAAVVACGDVVAVAATA